MSRRSMPLPPLLELDLMADQVQIIDATELQRWVESEPFNGGIPDVSPLRPVLLAQLYSNVVASAAKLALSRIFPDEHPIRHREGRRGR